MKNTHVHLREGSFEMRLFNLKKVVLFTVLASVLAGLLAWGGNAKAAGADEEPVPLEEETELFEEDEIEEEKIPQADEEQEMHQPPAIKKEKPGFPEGTKEVMIDLGGPSCNRHPKEIRGALMRMPGVLHVEAFNSRNHILVRYNALKISPDKMVARVNAIKGSGWRCDGTVSKRRRTER